MNPNAMNYDLSLMAKNYNLGSLNNLPYPNKEYKAQANCSESSSISLGSENLQSKSDNKLPIKIFNTNSVIRRNNSLGKDSFFKKRKRYIKNNKFVYVHPGSAAAKKMELEKVINYFYLINFYEELPIVIPLFLLKHIINTLAYKLNYTF
jgi:hypothetical protein